MKSDARLLLNKKKWNKKSGNRNTESKMWKSRGTVDARRILNQKRSQRPKPPVYGSYMRTKTATSLIASQIKKEITQNNRGTDKHVKLSNDGNIIVTSKSGSQMVSRENLNMPRMNIGSSSRSTVLRQKPMQVDRSSVDMDDLEHTAVDDLLDFETLPPALVATKSFQSLSRNSALSQLLDKRNTMVADQLSQTSALSNTKVTVSNLHPSVSKEDVMELFGEIGIIRGVEMLIPGTAVVQFYDEDDAAKACEIYNNRLLDGIPMKCKLQSASALPPKFAMSHRLGQKLPPYLNTSQVSPGSSSLPSTNSRSRYNPHNVQFTVKLT